MAEQKRCEECGHQYTPNIPAQKYCSSACRGRVNNRMRREAKKQAAEKPKSKVPWVEGTL